MSKPDERIEQMMRVLQVLHEKGLSLTDSLDVLRAFYDVQPTIKADDV